MSIRLLFSIWLLRCAPVFGFAQEANDCPFTPIPFTQVKIDGDFPGARFEISGQTTIPFEKCRELRRIPNLETAEGLKPGDYSGIGFNDAMEVQAVQSHEKAKDHGARVVIDCSAIVHFAVWKDDFDGAFDFLLPEYAKVTMRRDENLPGGIEMIKSDVSYSVVHENQEKIK